MSTILLTTFVYLALGTRGELVPPFSFHGNR